tara:strand:+ start:85 stop:945 length:861 start_codon:yes stop_codon:yes gene_type:complete
MIVDFYKRERDVLSVKGADSEEYLQGQLSQEISLLEVGHSAWSFILDPTGKVNAWLRVTKQSDEFFLLDTDGGWGESVLERLRRFLLRVQCDVQLLDWCMRTTFESKFEVPNNTFAIPLDWPTLSATDVIGPEESFSADGKLFELEDWEKRRVIAGFPSMGIDIEVGAIPASTGLVDLSVSFTKGCYTGQELVARIDSRKGGPPSQLAYGMGFLHSESEVDKLSGQVFKNRDPVGQITSVVHEVDKIFFLAYLKREVELPAQVNLLDTKSKCEILVDVRKIYANSL